MFEVNPCEIPIDARNKRKFLWFHMVYEAENERKRQKSGKNDDDEVTKEEFIKHNVIIKQNIECTSAKTMLLAPFYRRDSHKLTSWPFLIDFLLFFLKSFVSFAFVQTWIWLRAVNLRKSLRFKTDFLLLFVISKRKEKALGISPKQPAHNIKSGA